jgi:two-component system, sensor histidine kinase RegB
MPSPPAAPFPASASPHGTTLTRLYLLRYGAITGQVAVILLVHYGLDIPLPLLPMGAVLALYLLLNLVTHFRMGRAQPVTASELFGHLLADTTALTALLFFSGGWSNPFVSLLLLPVIIAAIVLPAPLIWATTAYTLAAYTFLANFNLPLVVHDVRAFRLHVLGMWFNFAVSALLVAYFIARLRRTIEARDAQLVRAREEALNNERIVAVGLVAAGAAHELATPLNTMTVLVDELNRESRPAGLGEDLRLLKQQLDRCKAILRRLTQTAQSTGENRRAVTPADQYLRALLEDWRLMRPQVEIGFSWEKPPAPNIAPDAGLDQALISLLNNAADASPQEVMLRGSADDAEFRAEILDRGPGLGETARMRGAALTSSRNGLGLGLFLSNATIEKLGGRVELADREGGGARVAVCIPLASLGARTGD